MYSNSFTDKKNQQYGGYNKSKQGYFKEVRYSHKEQHDYSNFGAPCKQYAKNVTYESVKDQNSMSMMISEQEEYIEQISKCYSPEMLRKVCNQDTENIKVVSIENPIDRKTMLVDISLAPKGIDEEQVYLKYPEYIQNIRRGNSFLDYYRWYRGEYIYQYREILRKGMKKFVDLPYEVIEMKEDHYKNVGHIQEEGKINARKAIFYPVFKAFLEGYSIEVIKLIKANGENAQVSYNERHNAWVISSKNVCLLAQSRSDLELYPPKKENADCNESSRFAFAYIIGHCWFDYLDTVAGQSDLIPQLKQFLKDKTLTGEYVGNQKHQHLIRYMKHTILFYSIVDNYSCDNSFTVLQAFEYFKTFQFDVVPYEHIGIFKDHKTLCQALEKLYVRIAESSIIEEEEGSVVYLSQTHAQSENDTDSTNRKNDKILSLCKLKTFEYRVYRKLREKIKNHLIQHEMESRRKINQFFEEVRVMLQGYSLPMPLSFYYKVAETAFAFANKFPQKCQDLQSSYIDFLEVIHSLVDQKVDLKSRVIKKDNIMTYDYLITNELKSKKVIEIIIYAPPLYLPESFLKALSEKYKTQIRNSFISSSSYVDVDCEVLIYHINMHNFRIFTTLQGNRHIISFGLNETECMKSLDVVKEKMKNPLVKSYNTNPTLSPFLNESNCEKVMAYFILSSKEFIEKSRKYIAQQISIYEEFDADKMDKYLSDIDAIVSTISERIKSIDFDQIKSQGFLYDNDTNLTKSIDSNNPNKESKYKNNPYIDLYEEHENPYEALKNEFIQIQAQENEKGKSNNIEESDSLSTSIHKDNSEFIADAHKKNVIVLIPMTIPGTGKTFFIQQFIPILQKYQVAFYSISSDLIRRNLMDELRYYKPDLSEHAAFEKAAKRAAKQFEDELKKTVRTISNGTSQNSLIYLDKNHPPNALTRVFEPIREELANLPNKDDMNVRFVALLSECGKPFIIYGNETKQMPFSLSYFIQCYLRVKNRKDHPTLNGDNKDLICILGLFVGNFINFALNEQNLILHHRFDKAIKLPFTDEVEEDNFPRELVDSARDFFSNITPTTLPPLDARAILFEDLINKYFTKPTDFFSSRNLVTSTVEPIIGKLYNLPIIRTPSDFAYLGLTITGKENREKMRRMLGNALEDIMTFLPGDAEIKNLIACIMDVNGEADFALPRNWGYPHKIHKNLWHVTTLFKGNDSISSVQSKPSYTEFKEGGGVSVIPLGVVYVPGKIITCFCKVNTPTENPIPHITCLVNGFDPKNSNEVVVGLFGKGGTLEKEYISLLSNDTSSKNNPGEKFIKESSFKRNGFFVTAYVAKVYPEVTLDGVMHAFE